MSNALVEYFENIPNKDFTVWGIEVTFSRENIMRPRSWLMPDFQSRYLNTGYQSVELKISTVSASGRPAIGPGEVIPGVYCVKVEHEVFPDIQNLINYHFEWNTQTGPQLIVTCDENGREHYHFSYDHLNRQESDWTTTRTPTPERPGPQYSGPRRLTEPPIEMADSYDLGYDLELGEDGELPFDGYSND